MSGLIGRYLNLSKRFIRARFISDSLAERDGFILHEWSIKFEINKLLSWRVCMCV